MINLLLSGHRSLESDFETQLIISTSSPDLSAVLRNERDILVKKSSKLQLSDYNRNKDIHPSRLDALSCDVQIVTKCFKKFM